MLLDSVICSCTLTASVSRIAVMLRIVDGMILYESSRTSVCTSGTPDTILCAGDRHLLVVPWVSERDCG